MDFSNALFVAVTEAYDSLEMIWQIGVPLLLNTIASLSHLALTLKYLKYRSSELPVISISVQCDVFLHLYVGFFED